MHNLLEKSLTTTLFPASRSGEAPIPKVEIALPDTGVARHTILGCTISGGTTEAVIGHIRERLARREQTALAFANANFLMQMRHSRDIDLGSFLVLNDGVAIDVAKRLLTGTAFPVNLNGTDFVPALLDGLPASTRVFLFGARPEVVARAAAFFAAIHPVEICGYSSGFGYDNDELVDTINNVNADVVLVALGNPRQERWIAENRERLDAALLVGVGALFDFVSGAVPRAPEWMRRARLEWLHRLMLEPRRLMRRYTIDTAGLFLLALQERWRSGPGSP